MIRPYRICRVAWRRVEDRQQRVEHRQDQRAEDRARVAAEAAEDRGAADHDRGHRREQERRRDPEVGGVVEADEQDPGSRAQHPAERVDGEQHLPVPHAREPAGDRVVADGVDHPPEAAVAQAEDDQRGDRRPHEQAVRDVREEPLRAELDDEVRHLGEEPLAG